MILNTLCPAPASVGWPDLAPELATLATLPTLLQGQDPIRAWEYARALRAIRRWGAQQLGQGDGPTIADLGGAGSNFWQLLATCTSESIVVIDPALDGTTVQAGRRILVDRALAPTPTAGFDIATCISVVEHIPTVELPAFFHAAAALLRPGGLFILTTDYWTRGGPDTAHFHWMRDHIYNPESLRELSTQVRAAGFETYGDTDLTWHGPVLYGPTEVGYSIATLAFLRKG